MKHPAKHRIAQLAGLCLLCAACGLEEDTDDIDATPVDLDEDDIEPPVVADYEPFDPADADDTVLAVAHLTTRVTFPEHESPSASARADAQELRTRFAHALMTAQTPEYFAARSGDDEVIEINYRGLGKVTDEEPESFDGTEKLDEYEIPERYADGARWVVGFNGETMNEFEVRIPAELAQLVGDDGRARGIHRGWPGEPEPLPRGLVGPNDTRVRKGQTDTAQTSTNLRRIVGFVVAGSSPTAGSQCTGTLIGRHHVVSAAHCIYQRALGGQSSGSWIRPGLRVGRNGSDWIAGANTSTGWRWFWVEASYLAAADNGNSPRSTDFGLIITPDRHIGASTGWFGWAYSNSSHDDMYNRGYPNPAPTGFHDHMYGDTNFCRTGDFTSSTDSYGYRLFGYHSCDTTGGQSGSPLYRRNGNGDWVVRGVHKGAGNPNSNATSSDNNLWNSFALVTRDRSDVINYFRALYP